MSVREIVALILTLGVLSAIVFADLSIAYSRTFLIK